LDGASSVKVKLKEVKLSFWTFYRNVVWFSHHDGSVLVYG